MTKRRSVGRQVRRQAGGLVLRSALGLALLGRYVGGYVGRPAVDWVLSWERWSGTHLQLKYFAVGAFVEPTTPQHDNW